MMETWVFRHARRAAVYRRHLRLGVTSPPGTIRVEATRTVAQTAVATHAHAAPMVWTRGRWSARPRSIPATAYMPSGKTKLHRLVSYRSGIRCRMCRHQPTATSTGISQVATHHAMTDSPAMTARVAFTMGALSISVICAPATAVIASAPIDTQYDGSRSAG